MSSISPIRPLTTARPRRTAVPNAVPMAPAASRVKARSHDAPRTHRTRDLKNLSFLRTTSYIFSGLFLLAIPAQPLVGLGGLALSLAGIFGSQHLSNRLREQES